MTSTSMQVTGALLLGLLAGCSGSLFKSEQAVPQTYRLTALAAEPQNAAPFESLLLVVRPNAAPGLDTERIAVLHPDRRLDYYAASQWGAALPEIVQDVVVNSLQNTGRLRGVQRDLGNFRPDFVLQLDVRAFQAEYVSGEAPRVRIDLIATIGRLDDRPSVFTFAATALEPADSNTMSAVAAAFDKALQGATRTVLANSIDYVARAANQPTPLPQSPAPNSTSQ